MRAPGGPNGQARNRPAVSPGRFAYPRASPGPARYSSPAAPTGTGSRAASSTNTCVLSSGRPIGTGPPSRCGPRTLWQVAKVTASVGPYPFTTVVCGHTSSTRSTAAGRAASPPAHTSRRPANSSGDSAAIRWNRPVVKNAPVTRPSRIVREMVARSRSPGGATTTVPPETSGVHSS
jgi:hypothetical protein